MIETISRIEFPDDFEDALAKNEISEDILKEIQRVVSEHSLGVTTVSPPPIAAGGFGLTGAAEYVYKLGTHTLPKNTRVHKHGTFDYRFETQSVEWEVFLTFRHPTMSAYVDDAITCAGAGAVVSVIAAVVLESPQAGLAIFTPSWKICMAAKISQSIANDITVELSKEKHLGSWEGH